MFFFDRALSLTLNSRIRTCEALTAAGIPCTVVLDSAVAYVMDKVDIVLVGSEAVVESGGLINALGSNQIAIIAKAAHKPFYAVAERYSVIFIGDMEIKHMLTITAFDAQLQISSSLSFVTI